MEEINSRTNLPAEVEAQEAEIIEDGKVLRITPETRDVDFQAFLGKVLDFVNLGEILHEIKAGTQYVVQIPTEFQKAYESGELFIMQNQRNGKIWPNLMRIGEDGRPQVVTPLPIKEQTVVQGNPVKELASGYHDLLMQREIARLNEKVEEIYRSVERIENGQMDDRIGLLLAGKNGLMLALSMPEGVDRRNQINTSRQNLLTAQAQIGETLRRRAGEFEPMPKEKILQFFRELGHSGYLSGKRNEVYSMQDYYDLYLQAAKLIATSYAIGGDLKTAEQSFRLAIQYTRSIDFGKVKSIGYRYKDTSDMFFNKSVEYIETEQNLCVEQAKNYDFVTLEVSGEKLLEVLENGKSEAISETKTRQ